MSERETIKYEKWPVTRRSLLISQLIFITIGLVAEVIEVGTVSAGATVLNICSKRKERNFCGFFSASLRDWQVWWENIEMLNPFVRGAALCAWSYIESRHFWAICIVEMPKVVYRGYATSVSCSRTLKITEHGLKSLTRDKDCRLALARCPTYTGIMQCNNVYLYCPCYYHGYWGDWTHNL